MSHSINASPSHAPINASQSTHPPFTHDHSPPPKPTVSLFPTLPLTQTRPFVTSHAPPQILLSFSPLPTTAGGWVPPSTNHQRWGPPAHYGDGVGRDKCLFLVVSFTFLGICLLCVAALSPRFLYPLPLPVSPGQAPRPARLSMIQRCTRVAVCLYHHSSLGSLLRSHAARTEQRSVRSALTHG